MSEKYFNYERLYNLLNRIVNFLYNLIYKKQVVKPHYEICNSDDIGALKVCNSDNFIDSSTCILKSNLPIELQDILDDGNTYVRLIEQTEILYEKFIRKPYTCSIRKTQFNPDILEGEDIYSININHNLKTKFINASIIDKDNGYLLNNTIKVVDENNIIIYNIEPLNLDISIIGWNGRVY